MWIVDCQVLDDGKLNYVTPKNDSNTKKFATTPKNLMMGVKKPNLVGMNFCGFVLQFIAPKNDNTFNVLVSCFPCQSTSLLSLLSKKRMKNTFSTSTTIDFCHPKDTKRPCRPLRVKVRGPKTNRFLNVFAI